MSQFAVNTDYLRGYANELEAARRTMDNIHDRLRMVQLGSVLQMNASFTMISRLSDCSAAVGNQADNLWKLTRGLNEIADLYDRFERDLTTPQPATDNGPSGWWDWIVDGTNTVISEVFEILGGGSGIFGILGCLFEGVNGDWLQSIQHLLSGGSGVVGAVFDLFGDTSPNWMEAFFGRATNPHSFSGAWNEFLDDMRIGGSRTAGQNASALCRWAGYALSFVMEGVDNYAEYHGDMGARFWSETLLEGAVDVGVGIGAGVLAAALLPATWPAVAVGAVGAGAVWLVDSVCEWTTGQDLSDLIVDPILNYAERRIERTVEVVEDVGRAIVDGANAVCDWIGGWF